MLAAGGKITEGIAIWLGGSYCISPNRGGTASSVDHHHGLLQVFLHSISEGSCTKISDASRRIRDDYSVIARSGYSAEADRTPADSTGTKIRKRSTIPIFVSDLPFFIVKPPSFGPFGCPSSTLEGGV